MTLTEYLNERSRQEFAPGLNDCALFQADCYKLLTGVDLAAEWRGEYKSYREGLALMRAKGYRDPLDFVKSIADAVPSPFARKGDLAFKRKIGGFVAGSVVYFLGSSGLKVLPLSNDINIYRVR